MSKKEKEVRTDDDIRRWVSQDLGCAVSLINMIRNDPEMLKAIQDIIITRTRTEEENKKMQPELDLNGIE